MLRLRGPSEDGARVERLGDREQDSALSRRGKLGEQIARSRRTGFMAVWSTRQVERIASEMAMDPTALVIVIVAMETEVQARQANDEQEIQQHQG